MSYTAIMDVVDNRVTKMMRFPTEQEALAHVAAHIADYPNAFVIETPLEPLCDWWIENNQLTIQPVPDTPEQIQKDKDNQDKNTIIQDSFVGTFIQMTPQEVIDYINTNVTNIASAKVVLIKLALMMLLMARREFRP